MFFGDHLQPHFHAEYGNFRALFEIANGELLKGEMPNKAKQLIKEWAIANRKELVENYEQSQTSNGILKKIKPLE